MWERIAERFIEMSPTPTTSCGSAPFGILSFLTVFSAQTSDVPVVLPRRSKLASLLCYLSHAHFDDDTSPSFDLDLPLEVDDEYWESRDDPRDTFKQPHGVPSLVSSFTQLIKLSQIIAFALKTLVRIMSCTT